MQERQRTYTVWVFPLAVAGVCFLWVNWAFYQSSLSYVESMHGSVVFSGRLATCLIILTFVTTPVRKSGLTIGNWLLRNRRVIGILGGSLLMLHLMCLWFYLQIESPSELIFFQIIGFPAVFMTMLMLLTSNNFSQRLMGKWWSRIHMTGQWSLWLMVFSIYLMSLVREPNIATMNLLAVLFVVSLWRLSSDLERLMFVTGLTATASKARPPPPPRRRKSSTNEEQ